MLLCLFLIIVVVCNGENLIKWNWMGNLTSNSITLKAKIDQKYIGLQVQLNLYEKTNFDQSVSMIKQYKEKISSKHDILTFQIDGLKENTFYEYKFSSKNASGKFQTPKRVGERFDFEFGFASCADNHSNSIIFDTIQSHNPLFFIHTGDLHYGNVNVNDEKVFHSMYDQVFSNPRQLGFFRNVPIAYMFDDHDFGPNNSDKSSPGREASLKAYREAVPHYNLQTKDDLGSVFQSFTIGRVKFIVTDTSSSKVGGETALGKEQLDWLLWELDDAHKHYPLYIWVSTIPWNSIHSKWGEFQAERKYIVDYIVKRGIHEKLLMICGDAHMLAFDDGEFSPGGFPVIQAAALDAKPTCKGGPYSHGIFPGRGQYGFLKISDSKEKELCWRFDGRRVDRETGQETSLLVYDTCNPENNTPRNTYYPSPVWVEKLWKRLKKKFDKNEIIMAYFDSFTFSLGMVFTKIIISVLCAIIICAMIFM